MYIYLVKRNYTKDRLVTRTSAGGSYGHVDLPLFLELGRKYSDKHWLSLTSFTGECIADIMAMTRKT